MNFQDMTLEELHDLRAAARSEIDRRAILHNAPARMDAISREVLDAEGAQEGNPWRQPSGAYDAYPEGWTVTHDGKTWESLVAGNVWEPGVSGWREVTSDGTPPEWVQPTGAHDAYQAGDRVTFNGVVYRSTIDGNVWPPGTQYWKEEA